MTHRRMLDSHPERPVVDADTLSVCIDACFECAQACTACADACLSEREVAELVDCIRADLDCADICEATGRLLSRYSPDGTNLARAFLDTCIAACRACGDECDRHASKHQHCRICADACRRCEQACQDMISVLA